MSKHTSIGNMYVFDLESCDGEYNINEVVPRQRVWLCGYMNIVEQKLHGYTSLDVALERMLKLGGNQNVEIGVHNLSFDGSFIVPALVNIGYAPVSGKPHPGQFSVLIDDRNNWYSIRVKVSDKRTVTFWDTLKLFPMPLKHLHQVYHTPTKKLDESQEFYERVRDIDYLPDDEEIAYFDADLRVLAEVLVKHIEVHGLGFKKTQASQAFYAFSQSFKAWKLRFPALTDKADALTRKAYWGGISYVNPDYEGLDMEAVEVYDINSSYPYQLATKRLPYGYMVLEGGKGERPYNGMFWVAKAVVRFTLKENMCPCIPKKAIEQVENFPGIKWLSYSAGLVELTFCSIDYVTIHQSYDFQVVEWLWTMHWPQKKHKELARFVHANNEDKIKYKELSKHVDGELKFEYLAKAQRAKINNNAFYGKFGEEIIKIGKTPIVIDGIVEYVEDREEVLSNFKRKFLPLAIATTAYARQQFVTFANIMGSDYIYGDTDSCHFNSSASYKMEGKLHIEDLELGAWSHDAHYDRARYLRPKTYIGEKEGKLEVTCAGLPADKDAQPGAKQRSCITWDNFHVGTIIADGNGKLRTIPTPTGKKLVPTSFEIGKVNIFDF